VGGGAVVAEHVVEGPREDRRHRHVEEVRREEARHRGGEVPLVQVAEVLLGGEAEPDEGAADEDVEARPLSDGERE
jgi:hypothetical protein